MEEIINTLKYMYEIANADISKYDRWNQIRMLTAGCTIIQNSLVDLRTQV